MKTPLRLQYLLEKLHAQVLRFAPRYLERRYLPGLSNLKKDETLRLLFVCKGNICRSPYAERKLEQLLADTSLKLSLSSCGLDTHDGKPANFAALEVAPEFGVNLDQHRTQQATTKIFQDADLLIAMEESQLKEIDTFAPNASSKAIVLGALSYSWREPIRIPDPYGHPLSRFRNCYRRIDMCLEKLLSRLR